MRRSILWGALAVLLTSCAAASGNSGSTTPESEDSAANQGRFEALEAESLELSPSAVDSLPDVAEGEQLFVVDAVLGEVEWDESTSLLTLSPPESWVVGSSEDEQEIRLDFLEPDGGQMHVEIEAPPEEGAELSVTWIVRYARRNVLLTEDGASVAVHVVPVAARLEIEGRDDLVWIHRESTPAP